MMLVQVCEYEVERKKRRQVAERVFAYMLQRSNGSVARMCDVTNEYRLPIEYAVLLA